MICQVRRNSNIKKDEHTTRAKCKKKLFEKNTMTLSQRKLKGPDHFINLKGGNSR